MTMNIMPATYIPIKAKKIKMLPLRGKKVGYFFLKILKMYDFNKKIPRATRKTTRTTCWRHITREFGPKSRKKMGWGWKS